MPRDGRIFSNPTPPSAGERYDGVSMKDHIANKHALEVLEVLISGCLPGTQVLSHSVARPRPSTARSSTHLAQLDELCRPLDRFHKIKIRRGCRENFPKRCRQNAASQDRALAG